MNKQFTRRELLKIGSSVAVVLGLDPLLGPELLHAMENIATGRVKVIWLQAQSCSGCSISLIDSEAPGPAELFTRYISLLFHHTFSAASGDKSIEVLDRTNKAGGHILVVEGSIPEGVPDACVLGETPINDLILTSAKTAKTIIALQYYALHFGGK